MNIPNTTDLVPVAAPVLAFDADALIDASHADAPDATLRTGWPAAPARSNARRRITDATRWVPKAAPPRWKR